MQKLYEFVVRWYNEKNRAKIAFLNLKRKKLVQNIYGILKSNSYNCINQQI